MLLDLAIVFALGLVVGTAELFSRYRDDPVRALASLPGIFYVALNAGAAVLALALVRTLGWTFGASGTATGEDAVRWTQVLVAGFGAMALFRSSLLTVRVGDQDVAVGPSSLLQIVFDAADRGVDRARAAARSRAVSRLLRDISFDKAHTVLPAYCIALMQNVPEDDAQALERRVAAISAIDMADDVRSLLLGLNLLNVVGEEVLTSALDALREDIKR